VALGRGEGVGGSAVADTEVPVGAGRDSVGAGRVPSMPDGVDTAGVSDGIIAALTATVLVNVGVAACPVRTDRVGESTVGGTTVARWIGVAFATVGAFVGADLVSVAGGGAVSFGFVFNVIWAGMGEVQASGPAITSRMMNVTAS
jgi:hypothetical protein